jgi:hypothetical protein
VARRLARTSTPALLAAIARGRAHPTTGGAEPLQLQVAGVYRARDGAYRAPLVVRDSRATYVATLVISSTSAGPRVARLER